MMKKLSRYFLGTSFGLLVLSNNTFGQATASAKWSMLTNQSSTTISHNAVQTVARIKVHNTTGKTFLQQSLSLNTTDTKLNVSQRPSGNYLLILSTQNQQSALEFIKQ